MKARKPWGSWDRKERIPWHHLWFTEWQDERDGHPCRRKGVSYGTNTQKPNQGGWEFGAAGGGCGRAGLWHGLPGHQEQQAAIKKPRLRRLVSLSRGCHWPGGQWETAPNSKSPIFLNVPESLPRVLSQWRGFLSHFRLSLEWGPVPRGGLLGAYKDSEGRTCISAGSDLCTTHCPIPEISLFMDRSKNNNN